MTKDNKNNGALDVLMFMGTQCTYCGAMMQALTELMKDGGFTTLNIVNIEQDPQLALKLGVRSVPWLQIGPFELSGSRTKQELQTWIKRASSAEGLTEYIEEMLLEGSINSVKKLIEGENSALHNVIQLMADPAAKINIRLGIGAIIEELAEEEIFKSVTPKLVSYLSDEDARIRGDACHYLSLTKDVSFIPLIENLLSDDSEEVREIAEESLEELRLLEVEKPQY